MGDDLLADTFSDESHAHMNNLEVALNLIHAGIPVFPCRWKAETIDGKPYGEKSPLTPDGHKNASTDEAVVRAWWKRHPAALVGMPTGSRSRLAVLDLDRHSETSDGIAALADMGLTPEDLTFCIAKTAGGGLHLYFEYVEGVTNRAKHLPSGMDIRGEGGYVIAPGSIFPDGRCYSAADVTLLVLPRFPERFMPPAKVERQPVDVSEASEFQREWAYEQLLLRVEEMRDCPEGRRYDTLRDIAFWAGGVGIHGALDFDTARDLLLEAAEAAGLSKGERERTFEKSWDDGTLKPIAMPDRVDIDADDFDDLPDADDEDILLGPPPTWKKPTPSQQKVAKAEVEYALGADTPKWVAGLNTKHAIAIVAGKTVILHFGSDGKVDYGSAGDLHTYYENQRVASGKTTVPITKMWLQSKHRRSYPRGVIFAPNRETPGAYNHWQGFSVPFADAADAEAGCRLFLKHLREVVCNGNDDYYRYNLGWLAHMVQKPEEKPGVAVVYKGRKRIGKDTVFDYVGRLFKSHYVTVAKQDHMTGKFNAHQEKCLLLHVQEGFWAGNKEADSSLKYLITSEMVQIEPKGVNAFQVPSVLRLFISSNESWVVPASEDEGRYFVLNVSDKRKGDFAYFEALRDEMNGNGPSCLLTYLMNYDLSEFRVRSVPDTDALAEQKMHGLKNVELWWLDKLTKGVMGADSDFDTGPTAGEWEDRPVTVGREDLRSDYRLWMRGRRFDGSELGDREFGKRMKLMCPSMTSSQPSRGGSRFRAYGFMPLEQCRAEFDTFIGSAIKWNEDDDDL